MLTIHFGSGLGPSGAHYTLTGAHYTLKCTYAHCTLKLPWLQVWVDIWTPDGQRQETPYMAPGGV